MNVLDVWKHCSKRRPPTKLSPQSWSFQVPMKESSWTLDDACKIQALSHHAYYLAVRRIGRPSHLRKKPFSLAWMSGSSNSKCLSFVKFRKNNSSKLNAVSSSSIIQEIKTWNLGSGKITLLANLFISIYFTPCGEKRLRIPHLWGISEHLWAMPMNIVYRLKTTYFQEKGSGQVRFSSIKIRSSCKVSINSHGTRYFPSQGSSGRNICHQKKKHNHTKYAGVSMTLSHQEIPSGWFLTLGISWIYPSGIEIHEPGAWAHHF